MPTPNSKQVTALKHNSLYRKENIGDYYYHCEARPYDNSTRSESIWTVWREHKTDGHVDCPVVNNIPQPDGHPIDDLLNLTYWFDVYNV